ncbi:right-handed parallel beta-helix repeat-containing protein [Geobacter sp.]|uniref:right-handed parallel beta-helix repeat-containing protein n=1 Tax=Geobacter sp. TaxID=46610 RepID=UPI00262D6AE7|nr:right-handed parallel beta-helix repeat-containing protein [Geobacter sp.]
MRCFVDCMVRRKGIAFFGISCVAVLLSGCGTLSGLWGGRSDASSAGTPRSAPLRVVSSPVVAPVRQVQKDAADEMTAPSQAKPLPPPERAPLPGAGRIAPPPAAMAGVRVYRDEVLVEDTVWRGEVVVEGSVMVSPQTTLTVEPGAVVRFRRTSAGVGAGPRLLVQGRFVVRGSAESPARFTSVFPEPRAGDWEGIVLLGSQKKNELDHARIEGATIGVDAVYSTVYLRDVDFHNCGTGGRFQDGVVSVGGGEALGGDVGMEFTDSEADVRDASVARNRVGLMVRDSSLNLEGTTVADNATVGLSVDGGRIRLERNLFVGNGTGLVLEGCEGEVARGRIAGNREAGIVLTRSRVKVVANEIAENAAVGLRVDDGRGAAWGNVFVNNGRYDLYNSGSEAFRAMANWWGESSPESVEKKVSGAVDKTGRGGVLLTPALRAKPLLPALNYIAK